MPAKIRAKCMYCGKPFNTTLQSPVCPHCNQFNQLSSDGYIYLYRQGSPYGIAGGFGIFINGVPVGYIGNRELLCFPLAYGTYNLHCAVGMSRKCQDMQITLTPQNRFAYAKVYIKPGFWANSFVIQPVDPNLLEL